MLQIHNFSSKLFFHYLSFLFANIFLAPESGSLREIQIQNKFQKIANFKRDYLDNDNDSEFTVKTKNAPFFMNFPNIYKLWQISLI